MEEDSASSRRSGLNRSMARENSFATGHAVTRKAERVSTKITNRIVTTGGRTDEWSFTIYVEER